MNRDGDGDGDLSRLLNSFDKLSVSKGKGQGINVSSDPSITASTSTEPSRVPRIRKDPHFKRNSSEWRRRKKKIWYVGAVVEYNDFVFRTPCPTEPFIGIMKYKDCHLDKRFSTEIDDLTAPERLGHFSCHINPDGKTQSYHPDKSSARYLAYDFERKPKLDLLEGFSEHLKWGRVPPGEMHLLRWFYENSYDLTDDDGQRDVDFICYTRMLRSIMSALYNQRDDWICIATKVRGSIIIDEIDTPKRKAWAEIQTLNQKKSSYAGYKFEEKITRRYDGKVRPTYAQGNRDSFYIVSKLKTKNHSILYCNRVDCATNKFQLHETLDEMECAQIKTRACTFKDSQSNLMRMIRMNRVLSWWIESWLGKMRLIVVGEKTKGNQLDKVMRMKVESLFDERNGWSPRTCVSFLDLFLSFIKRMVTDDLTPYRFYCAPGRAIVCQKLKDPPEKYLPSWFINDEAPID